MSITKSFYKRRLSMTQYDTQTSANKTKVSKTPKLLKSLRSRKSLNNTILPEDAAEVVKNYLIPMFDRKIRSKTKKQKTELTNQSFDITNSEISCQALLIKNLLERFCPNSNFLCYHELAELGFLALVSFVSVLEKVVLGLWLVLESLIGCWTLIFQIFSF